MDFAGLVGKFRANRPLGGPERKLQLKQKQHLDVAPHYQLSVIEMNSTYLESVDKWYGAKGTITFVTLTIITMFSTLMLGMLHTALTRDPHSSLGENDFSNLIIVAAMTVPALFAASWLLRKESFAFTHYPMRFNRVTHMVHVFRTNGTVLSVPWDDIVFVPTQIDHLYRFWNVIGHVMSADKTMIEESFALSVISDGTTEGIAILGSHWEFVRRYMEDGPAAVHGQVQFCMPINQRRETFHVALHRLLIEGAGGSGISNPLQLFGLLFNLLVLPFRWFAMRTSKIPSWPTEVEATSAIPDDDPYAIAGSPKGDRIAVFPNAAQAADVRFTGAPDNPPAAPARAGLANGGTRTSSAPRGKGKHR